MGSTIRNGVFALALLSGALKAHADISLSATRVVFDGKNKEQSVVVRNGGTQEVMLQSWLDASKEASEDDTPFVVTPPLAKLQGGKQQLLRILYSGEGAAADRESVYWLNAQEIPLAANEQNTLQIAVRQRIKVFYRPAGLPGKASEAPTELQWHVVRSQTGQTLQVTNPTVYHVSYIGLEVTGSGQTQALVKGDMVSPGETRSYPLRQPSSSATGLSVSYQAINDYGAAELYQAGLNDTISSQAKRVEKTKR
jgi:P pilus assembly chaperone PapD